jgi:outer membrane receptor protein involved in Fe transport
VGGVINVIPKRWRGAPGAEVNADIGTHDSRNMGAAVGAAGDNFDVRLSASEFRTGGYIAQPVADPAGDKDLAPRDWKDSKWSLNGAVYPSADQEISFGYQQYRVDTALMGGRPNYRQNHNGDAYTLGYRKDLAGGGSFKLSYRNNSLRQDMRNDDQAWNGTMDSYVLAGTFYRHSDTDSIDAQATVPLSDDNTLTYGASYLTTRYETGWDDLLFGGNSRSRSSAEAAAVFIQDEHRFGDLALTVGGRNDRIHQGSSFTNGTALNGGAVEETFNPRLGLRYRPSPATSFYASVGTAFVPASADLKFPGNPVNWQNNPGLKPETSTTHEVGVNQRLTWGTWHAALYHTDYKDQISSVSVGGTPWPKKYVNIGKVTVDGLEVGLQGELAGGWKPYINYAYTDSVIKENPTDPLTVGKHTQRVAPQKVNLGVLYAPGDAWSLCLAGRYVDERYFTDRNTPDHRAPSYFVADAKLTVRLPAMGAGKWDAYLAVNNLFNEKYTVWEYENADRLNVWFGVNGKF